ncbi:hypothetical protein L2E82_27974 [Cichorium intybus]|uniref:Uncharacterized protein n=1 Tax=Cichorium intybus TaxID=13427 RepID=A0ACB9CUN2_CICIN|nr:hypothetical protein L2E82_27974 [Cichorium intybus]
MLLAKEALHKSSDVKLFNLMPSTESRFEDVIELQRQQVFCIKYKIESQRHTINEVLKQKITRDQRLGQFEVDHAISQGRLLQVSIY